MDPRDALCQLKSYQLLYNFAGKILTCIADANISRVTVSNRHISVLLPVAFYMRTAPGTDPTVAICRVLPVLLKTSYLLISQACSTSPPS